MSNKGLTLVNLYLYIEKPKDEIILKIPNVKVKVNYNTKGNSPYLLQLKCFCYSKISYHKLTDIKEKINSIADGLQNKLSEKIEKARHSVA